MAALSRQETDIDWELLVVDNGSNDGTRQIVESWIGRFPELRLLDGPDQPSFTRPRIQGVDEARADRFAFCDGDDVVSPGWVDAMHRALEHHGLVTGPLDLLVLNEPWKLHGDHAARWSAGPPRDETFLPYAMGCNMGMRRDVVECHGLYDTTVPSGHDKELSWRYQLTGVTLHFAPDAVIHRRIRSEPRQVWRQHIRFGRSNARLYRRFRADGMRRTSVVDAAAVFGWGLVSAPMLVRRSHRHRWAELVGLRVGRVLGSIESRVFYP